MGPCSSTIHCTCLGFKLAQFFIFHLQDEIDALRARNAQIVAVGERLAQQLPNRPFVGGYRYL